MLGLHGGVEVLGFQESKLVFTPVEESADPDELIFDIEARLKRYFQLYNTDLESNNS